MKRIIAIVVSVAVALAAIGGVVVLALDDGPTAATVGDTQLSQQYVDDELRVLGENETLRQAVQAAQAPPLSNADGSVTADVGSGWLGLMVSQELAAQTVERRALKVTDADRTRGEALATDAVGGQEVYASLPGWFQDRLVSRWTPVAVLEREVTEDPPPALLEQLDSQCPSGRYVSHILVDTEAEAQALEQQLAQGADFAELAKRSSKDTGTAAQGGELGCIDGQSFVEPFGTVAATQPVGVVSDPVPTEFGSHLVLVTDEPPASSVEQLAIQEALGRTNGAVVQIDPRYGTWDRATGQVHPPAGTAVPSAAPTG
jgi:hypothetical protein